MFVGINPTINISLVYPRLMSNGFNEYKCNKSSVTYDNINIMAVVVII